MKTRTLLFLSLFATTLYSCTKNEKTTEEQQQQTPLLSHKDPQAISAAAKVWHGERLQGSLPAPKGSSLVLDAANSFPVTRAFAGRYAIYQPSIERGNVVGYYVQFTGAKEYFKIDYSKPRGGRVQPGGKPSSPFRHDLRQSRVQGGNEDSAIVIALPANLQVPDTFCVSYCAYDDQGNVSNVLNTCIIVSSLATDAANAWINGAWRNTATWDTSSRDTIIYNKWMPESYSWGYVCRFDSVANDSFLDYNYNGGQSLVKDSVYHSKSHLTMGSNGGMTYDYQYAYKYVDLSASSCSQFNFMTGSENQAMTGAWSYNAATNKAVYVFEFNNNGIPSLEAWEYKVQKISSNNMVLYDDSHGYPYFIRFEK